MNESFLAYFSFDSVYSASWLLRAIWGIQAAHGKQTKYNHLINCDVLFKTYNAKQLTLVPPARPATILTVLTY